MAFLAAGFSRRLLALLALAMLSACTVVVDEGPGGPYPGPGPRPGPGPGPQYCSRDYNPVCATRRGERKTFANGCLADRAGYDIVRPGECRREPVEEQRFCTREYRPVCGQRGGSLRTFSNSCEADVAGFRVVDRGPC